MITDLLTNAGVVAFFVGVMTLAATALLIVLLDAGWSLAWTAVDWMMNRTRNAGYTDRSFVRRSASSSSE